MHLSPSTVPSDPSLLALLFPGVTPHAPSNAATPPDGAGEGVAAFDAVFAAAAPAPHVPSAGHSSAERTALAFEGSPLVPRFFATESTTPLAGDVAQNPQLADTTALNLDRSSQSQTALSPSLSSHRGDTPARLPEAVAADIPLPGASHASIETAAETLPSTAAKPSRATKRESDKPASSAHFEIPAHPSAAPLATDAVTPSFSPALPVDVMPAPSEEPAPAADAQIAAANEPHLTVDSSVEHDHRASKRHKPAAPLRSWTPEATPSQFTAARPAPDAPSSTQVAAPGSLSNSSSAEAKTFAELRFDAPSRVSPSNGIQQLHASDELPTAMDLPSRGPEATSFLTPSKPSQPEPTVRAASAAANPGENAIPRGGEAAAPAEFAVLAERFSRNAHSTEKRSVKNSVSATSQHLTKDDARVGTSVANSVPVMFSEPTTAVLPHPRSEYATDAVFASGAIGEVTATLPEALPPSVTSERPAELSTAQRAVEVVLHAVDRVGSREQSAVKLEFSVGGEDLVVRVELRADEVRTTFRTDSPELRDALAQEWQSVAASSSERGVRLAPAQFASGEHQRDALGGDAASQQHGRSPTRQDDSRQSTSGFTRPSASSAPDSSSTAGLMSPGRVLAPEGTARRLHLFA